MFEDLCQSDGQQLGARGHQIFTCVQAGSTRLVGQEAVSTIKVQISDSSFVVVGVWFLCVVLAVLDLFL